MGLAQGNMNQGPEPIQEPTPQQVQAFEQMRQQVPSRELTGQVLETAAEEDPEMVGYFKEILNGTQLPRELVDALTQLIDAIFKDPSLYPQLVQALTQLGVDAEDIPQQFDAEFVSGLRMALDQVQITDEPMQEEAPVQGFSEGGEVSMKPIAKYMASLGRNGDTILAHINPQEARLLKAMGGSGTINPYTGLPEFFIKKLFKGVKNAVKGVVKGVKNFAKSKVGRFIIATALAVYAGPKAFSLVGAKSLAAKAAVAGFVGAAGSGLLAGDGLKNSIVAGAKTAAFAAVAAPAISAAMPGQGGTYGERFSAGFKADGPGFGAFGKEVPSGGEGVSYQDTTKGTPSSYGEKLDPNAFNAQQQLARSNVKNVTDLSNYPTDRVVSTGREGINAAGGINTPIDTARATGIAEGAGLGTDAYSLSSGNPQLDSTGMLKSAPPPSGGLDTALVDKPTSIYNDPNVTLGQKYRQGLSDLYAGTKKIFTGNIAEGLGMYGDVAVGLPKTTLALGTVGLAKAFEPDAPGRPNLGPSGYDLFARNPEKYGIQFFRPQTYDPPPPPPVMLAREGGIAQNFPRRNGAINGPGTGTSDDIPAMLSDGEFVFTAKAVRNAGGGDRKKGASKMYSMMKRLEGMG